MFETIMIGFLTVVAGLVTLIVLGFGILQIFSAVIEIISFGPNHRGQIDD